MEGSRWAAALLLSLIGPSARAQDFVMTTVAGGGPRSGPAVNAPLGETDALASDGQGGFYVGSWNLSRLFRVSSLGELSVAAGHGGPTFDGDGGPAGDAGLALVSRVAADANGNLYMVQLNRHVVRRLDRATGVVTRLAGTGAVGFAGDGGPALAASFNNPSGMAADAAGNLYVADSQNHRVRRVDAATGLISTFAGTGAAAFSGDGGPAKDAAIFAPEGLALGPGGHLFIGDHGNHRVRRVDAVTGIITTVAGNGGFGTAGDGGPALAASLNFPSGLGFDAQANLFIADWSENRVRRVDATTGVITTLAGTGTPGFGGDGGPAALANLQGPHEVAVDAGGNVLIADSANGRVRRVDAVSGTITTVAGNGDYYNFDDEGSPATDAWVTNPLSVATDAAGNTYLSTALDFSLTWLGTRIRRIDAQSGRMTSLLFNEVGPLTMDPAGRLIYGTPLGEIWRWDLGAPLANGTHLAGNRRFEYCGDGGPAVDACLSGVGGIAADRLGNVFFSDAPLALNDLPIAIPNNRRVRRIDAGTGIITTVAGDGSPATLNLPRGIAIDGNGNLFIADVLNCQVMRRAAGSGALTVFAGSGACGFGGDGGAAAAAKLNQPSGVAVDDRGNVFIADSPDGSSGVPATALGNHRIRRVDGQTGIITTVVGTGEEGSGGDGGLASNARLTRPAAIALDPAGGLLIADVAAGRLRRATPVRPLAVDDAAVMEGHAGTSPLTFSVGVVAPGEVRVDYSTNPDTAQPGSDFTPASGQLVFPPGTFARTVSVEVRGDRDVEQHERFFLDLSNPVNAVIERGRAVGTILDDDRPLDFRTLAPCRLVDTRTSAGPQGGPALVASASRRFVLGGSCGIPSSARAVSVNVTVTEGSGPGDLRLFPGQTAVPLASVINYGYGHTRAQNAVIALGPEADLTVRCDQSAGRVHFILDVNGYFE